jgi:hypothetical protein
MDRGHLLAAGSMLSFPIAIGKASARLERADVQDAAVTDRNESKSLIDRRREAH